MSRLSDKNSLFCSRILSPNPAFGGACRCTIDGDTPQCVAVPSPGFALFNNAKFVRHKLKLFAFETRGSQCSIEKVSAALSLARKREFPVKWFVVQIIQSEFASPASKQL